MSKYRHRATFPALILALLLACSLLLFAYHQLHERTTLPPERNLSKIGIELTQEQRTIDLHELKAHGVDFVYLRATQGRSYFDDNYDFYRSQLQGMQLPFGTVVYFSNESTVHQQLAFYQRKVGSNSGALPVMLVPAPGQAERTQSFQQKMGQFAQALLQTGKQVLVADVCASKYLPQGAQRMYTGKKLQPTNGYAFWRYTQMGRVNKVAQLKRGVTMFAYLGSSQRFNQLYLQQLR